MSISQDELQKIAKKLSKLPAENPKLLGNITDVLGYMDLLQEVDTTGVTPTVSVVDKPAHLREDIQKQESGAMTDELLACSKQKVVSGQIILPNIMN